MKWNVAILLCCSVALGQTPSKSDSHLPNALASVLAEVKSRSHLAVLLPSELPAPFAEAKLAVIAPDSKDGYDISLYYETSGGGILFAASFSGNAHPDFRLNEIPNLRKVKLSHGIVGYFREVGCGGSCAPANLWWEEDHVLYQIQLELSSNLPDKEQQRRIIATANSAILADPR
jgi:hypothetical protein